MFELYQLRYFMAVVETVSFSLTEAGTRFLARAKSILYECNQASLELQKVDMAETLRLGLLRTIPARLLGRLIADFKAREPGALIELIEGTEQEIANRLEEGSLDLALTISRPERQPSDSLFLFEEGYGLALPATHAFAGQTSIDAGALSDERMIVRSRCEVLSETSRFFTDHNVRPPLVYRTDHDERALSMVASGLGITLMPDCYRSDDVHRVRLKGFDYRRRIALVPGPHDSDGEKARVTQQFRDICVSENW